MFDNLICWYGEYFINEKNDGFRLIKSKVCIELLSEMYEKFIRNKEAEPFEIINHEKKRKYYDTACKFYSEMEDRLKASKSCYVLELITSTY